MARYRGDDFQAFDGEPIEINLIPEEGEELPVISKAVFVINNEAVVKTYENPEFPLYVELNSEDTIKLSPVNIGKLIIWDDKNRKKTIDECVKFTTEPEVYDGGKG